MCLFVDRELHYYWSKGEPSSVVAAAAVDIAVAVVAAAIVDGAVLLLCDAELHARCALQPPEWPLVRAAYAGRLQSYAIAPDPALMLCCCC